MGVDITEGGVWVEVVVGMDTVVYIGRRDIGAAHRCDSRYVTIQGAQARSWGIGGEGYSVVFALTYSRRRAWEWAKQGCVDARDRGASALLPLFATLAVPRVVATGAAAVALWSSNLGCIIWRTALGIRVRVEVDAVPAAIRVPAAIGGVRDN